MMSMTTGSGFQAGPPLVSRLRWMISRAHVAHVRGSKVIVEGTSTSDNVATTRQPIRTGMTGRAAAVGRGSRSGATSAAKLAVAVGDRHAPVPAERLGGDTDPGRVLA